MRKKWYVWKIYYIWWVRYGYCSNLFNVRDLIWIVNNWNFYIFDCFNRDGWVLYFGGFSRGGVGVDWFGDLGVV